VLRKPASFRDRVAIVTGGASGIGLAMGAQLAAAGARVVLADVNAELLTHAATQLAGSVWSAPVDVRDAGAVRALVADVVDRHGRIDLMFNNAGIVIGGRTDEMGVEYWQRVFDVNLNGVVNGVAAAYPFMVEQGHGHIVNTASTAGLAPAVMVAAYSASKHAVVGLSGALRAEAAMRGVRVSVMCPGSVDTPILDAPAPADLAPLASPVLTGREYMKFVGLKPIPPEQFAHAALRGVARNRAVIVAPASAKAVWYLQRFAPGLVGLAGRRTARRVSRELDKRR
jgi:NAD(P)-dependent dehydrogenase (short-subunit alcohol dehydrogenase family)